MSGKRPYRCAIYTRKSHEEGLDQAYNSLDAQREACEAYVLSQAGLGWELSGRLYDDGGVSGSHMERDGLKALLSDIRAGQVDVVVVCKVDRLTRSVADFGKLVEVFDEHDVSLVSVTQAFNKTNSMGRLTLNVLLSFAQFEREVTAKRIRDKIASSKQKGMWMGGHVPFGYSNKNTKLVIEPDEAKTVRLMFDLYCDLQNMRLVKTTIDGRGIISRARMSKSGKTTGGVPFSIGNIASILSNAFYAGQIKHKDKVYPGNHETIINMDHWEQVQRLLSIRSVNSSTQKNCSSPALFAGLLTDEDGNKLVSHHANKKGNKYHYYVSRPERETGRKPKFRIPTRNLDALIRSVIQETLESKTQLLRCLSLNEHSVDQIEAATDAAQSLISRLTMSDSDDRKAVYTDLIRHIIIKSDGIVIEFESEGLGRQLGITLPARGDLQIERQMIIRRRGQKMKLVIGGLKSNQSYIDQPLINLIAKTYLLKTDLETGKVRSIKEFADAQHIDHGDAKNLIPLSYLAPSIIEDILAGRQPADLSASRLKEVARRLPIAWSDQRVHLGFAA